MARKFDMGVFLGSNFGPGIFLGFDFCFTAVKRVKFAKVKRNTSKSRLLLSLSKV